MAFEAEVDGKPLLSFPKEKPFSFFLPARAANFIRPVPRRRSRGPGREDGMGVASTFFLCAFAAADPAAGGARQQAQAPGDTLVLPQARAERTLASDPGRVVVSEADLHRGLNLAEALKAVPGFRVRAQSGLGGYAETWFRGTDGRQITVYLDDVPLTSSLEPAADLGRISPLMIREMIVEKDAGPGDPDGGAAAIRLSTVPLGSSPVTVTGRLSSFGGREGALGAKAGRGPWALYLSGGAVSAENDFPYPSDNGTTFNGSDDARPVMENNAFRDGWGSLAWRREGEAGSFGALGISADIQRKRYPGIYTSVSRAYTDRGEISLHGGFADARPEGALARLSGAASARFSSDAYRDPGRTLGYRSYALDRSMRFFSAAAGAELRAPSAFTLELGSRAGYETSDSRSSEGFLPYSAPDAERLSVEPFARLRRSRGRWSAAAEGIVEWARENSETVAGTIGAPEPEPYSHDAVGATGRISLAWDGGAFGRWKAEAERLQRLPSLFERLGDNNGVRKNMDLEPQEVEGYSLAGEIAAGPARFTGGPFLQINRKPVRLAPLGAADFLHFVNGADYAALGWETRCDAEGPRWRAGESVTLTLPRILAGQGSLSGNMPAYASALESLADVSFSPLPTLWLDLDWEYRTPYYPGDLNLAGTRREAESLIGAGVRWRKRRIEAGLRADNLLGAYYQDFAYSPESGRRFAFQISMNP